MNLRKEELKQEFARQVSLCTNVGYNEMINAINKHFNISTKYETHQLNQLKSIADTIVQIEEGEAIIQLIANGNKLDPFVLGNLGQMQSMIVGMSCFNDDFKEMIIDAAEELK